MINGKGDPPNLDTIIKILKMTTSDNDNITLMAIKKANAQLIAWGWDWEAILRGKVKVMPDPFANIPSVQTRAAGQRPGYAPPTPPKQFDNATEIEGYFTKLDLKPGKRPFAIQDRISQIEKAWNAKGFLIYAEYSFLKTEANRRTRY
jgi:hypothetical protein